MKKVNKFKLYGNLTVSVYSSISHKRIRRFRIKNQVVNGARIVLAELLSQITGGTATADNRIKSLRVGTDNTSPVASDTNLGTVVFKMQLTDTSPDKVIDTDLYEFQIQKTLATGEGNGNTLVEAGLFTRGDNDDPDLSTTAKLFARQIHPAIVKTVAIYVTYNWDLGIDVT